MIIIEPSDGGLWGYFPDVPGCVTAGDSLEAVLCNAREALDLHLEEDEPPPARNLSEVLADPEVELSGHEVIAFVDYEPQALASV